MEFKVETILSDNVAGEREDNDSPEMEDDLQGLTQGYQFPRRKRIFIN